MRTHDAERIVAADLDHTRRVVSGRLDRRAARQPSRLEAFLDETRLEDSVATLAFRAVTLARRSEPTEADADAFAWEYDAGRRARPLAVHVLGRMVRADLWSVDGLIDTVLPYLDAWPERRRACSRLDRFRPMRELVAATIATPRRIGLVSDPIARTLARVHRALDGSPEGALDGGATPLPTRRRCDSAHQVLAWLLHLRAEERSLAGEGGGWLPRSLTTGTPPDRTPPDRIRAGFRRGRGGPRAKHPRARSVFAALDAWLDAHRADAEALVAPAPADAPQSVPGFRAAFRLSSS